MKKKNSREHAMISYIQKQRRTNHKDFQNSLFACFLSHHEPTKISQAFNDESWVGAMHEELLQFKIQKVWTLVDLPYGKKAIGTKWRKPYMVYIKLLELDNAQQVSDEFNGRTYFLLGFTSQAKRRWDLHSSGQCKKQTMVANSTTEAEFIAASHCCGQVLWIQNQILNYGYNFIQTKIHVDNKSAICVIKNLVYHSKTKHIEIRHYFIRDSYEKRLIEMVKIHTDHNVVDLLTKAFDASRFNFLVASIGMLNL
ncbi:hypothetical protein Tco_1114872 [Tanacetum coccineum]